VSSYARGDLGGMASTAMGLFKKVAQGDDVYQRNLRTKTSPADVIMWSGSKDSQTSYVPPISIFNLAPLSYQNQFQFPHLPVFKAFDFCDPET
jgi:hypothetical protein